MTKLAFTNPDGSIAYIYTNGEDDKYADGLEYDGLTAHLLPENVNETDVLMNWYWNNGWAQKGEKPSQFHHWDFGRREWVFNAEEAKTNIKQRRCVLLFESDYTQFTDVNIANKGAWAVYRQALRDITLQPGFPENVVWPIAPNQV